MGTTCLRKIQACFEARNLPYHLLTAADEATWGMSHEEREQPTHVYAVDDSIDCLENFVDELDRCARCKHTPWVESYRCVDSDADVWIRVDRDRIMSATASRMADEAAVVEVARRNAAVLLSAASCSTSQRGAGTSRSHRFGDVVDVDNHDEEDGAEYGEEDEEYEESEEDYESDFIVDDDVEVEDEQEDEEEARPMMRSTRSQKKRARVVLDSESDYDESQGPATRRSSKVVRQRTDPNVIPRVTRLQAAQKRAAEGSDAHSGREDTELPRRSRRQQSCQAGPSSSNAPAAAPTEQSRRPSRTETNAEPDAEADVEAEAVTTEPQSSDGATARPARASAHGPAQSMAIAMRIGRGGGARELPSRNAALMGLLQVSTELTRRGEHDLARLIDVGVLTLRETMEIAQRARGRASVE